MLMTEDSYRLKRDQHEKYFNEKQKGGLQKDARLVIAFVCHFQYSLSHKLQPKPVKKSKYCTVCHTYYGDYIEVIIARMGAMIINLYVSIYNQSCMRKT